MHKIVIIDHEPFTQRRKDLFFIQNFIDEGFDIQVWDISQYIFGNIHINGMLNNEKYVTKIKTYKQLTEKLNNFDIDNTIFWVECLNSWRNRSLYRLLSQYRCYILRVDLYANTNLYESPWKRMQRICSKSIYKIIKEKIYSVAYSLYKRAYKIEDFKRYLSSSALVNRTDIINHPDYEKFRFNKNIPIINTDYIIFCDTYFPFHPDLTVYYNCKNLPDGKSYQTTLKHFFDYLENVYKMPVIIAAHPKANYKGNEFGNRQIIQYHTDNLVLNSKMVIQHASNSISYAVLKNKPVAFITTNDYNNVRHLKRNLALLASTLGKEAYNLDKTQFEKIKITPIDDVKRKQYIYTYLTSVSTENLKNWEILKTIVSIV